jgi:hypothetical protein
MSADPDEIPWDVVLTMRHLRRLAKSRSFVREVTVQRVRQATGEVYERKVRRKVSYLRGRSVGFLAVNDGPSTARDIARILHNVEGPGRDPRASYDLVA